MDATARPSRLVLALHNHQPVGNFDSVFEHAVEASYRPFLRMLRRFPTLRVVLHTSGSLLEWLLEHAGDYIDELRDAIEAGQVEILGGPLQEPILAAIPRRDRLGQIRAHTRLIRETYGVEPRGMWVPERVWEHGFAGDVTAAGIRYTLLDDSHFRAAGLTDDELTASFVCEDEGRLLRVFPIHERLRYIIPFHPVDEVMDEIRQRHEKRPGSLIIFADDGEKFGVWPRTFQSVYEEGWLETFFSALVDASEWLTTTTLSTVAAEEPAAGLISLPDTSYREMTEWVLPTSRQRTLVDERKRRAGSDPQWANLKDFVRGGTWRNFLSKYPEAAAMAARMKEVSHRVERARQESSAAADVVAKATELLYRGQCNCPYWHGAFGGLYLSHLRQATYKNLIDAETLIESLAYRSRRSQWLTAEVHDFDFDLRPEVKLSSHRIAAYLDPSSGGQLYELDIRGCGTNLMATLARRPEPYHFLTDSRSDIETEASGQSSCDQIEFVYDDVPLRSLTERFAVPGSGVDAFQLGTGIGVDSPTDAETRVERSDEAVWCHLSYRVTVEGVSCAVEKSVGVVREQPGDLRVRYVVSELPSDASLRLGIDLYLAGIAPNADDRYLYRENGERLGRVNSQLDLVDVRRVGAVDEWLGLDVAFDWSQPADLWVEPIETLSGSEAGMETTYQATRLVPQWDIHADADGRWALDLTLSTDTSAAQARHLAERSASKETDLLVETL